MLVLTRGGQYLIFWLRIRSSFKNICPASAPTPPNSNMSKLTPPRLQQNYNYYRNIHVCWWRKTNKTPSRAPLRILLELRPSLAVRSSQLRCLSDSGATIVLMVIYNFFQLWPFIKKLSSDPAKYQNLNVWSIHSCCSCKVECKQSSTKTIFVLGAVLLFCFE